ncbi:MAG TPA: NHL repeat-containing protein [Vicinamibacterales bacterium]
MKRIAFACAVAAAVMAGSIRLPAAETARLRYVLAVYVDEKGEGLKLPEGIACGKDGQVIVADTGNDRLLRFTFNDKSIAGGTEIKLQEVGAPSHLQVSSKGEIYAIDGRQRRVVRIGADGAFKNALNYSGMPGPSTVIAKDLAIDAADTLYVLDVFASRVLVLNDRGEFQRAVKLPDTLAFGSDLAVDGAGNLLLLDAIGRRIYTAAKDATVFTRLGGDLTSVIATMPTAMTTSKGVIFVLEGIGSSVVALGRDGSFIAHQLTMGWNEGALNHPSQMCVNERDEAFIADRDNSRVQVFQLLR